MAGTTLNDIRLKIRRITGRPSDAQITNDQIDDYINTFYLYDFPEHLRLEPLRVNYQFVTSANKSVYDFPIEYFLTNMPPVYIAGYRSYMTQSRDNYFRINSHLNYLQQDAATGDGTTGPYSFTLTNLPALQGFKRNPPGAFSTSVSGSLTDVAAKDLNWNVLISGKSASTGTGGIAPSISLIDDGQGNLFDPADTSTDPTAARGTINYLTGAVTATFASSIANGESISAQYVPYTASRPQSVAFFQDQFYLWPVPDQAYTVSFEAFKYPTELLQADQSPQLKEWWQCLAYGAADKILTDNADFENAAQYRPLLNEQLRLILRRTIVQQTSERTATIYTDQYPDTQYPGNLYGGF